MSSQRDYAGSESVANAMFFTSTSGAEMPTAEGRSTIDAIATHYTINPGHCHPELSHAIYGQLLLLGHVNTTRGFTTEPTI